MKKVTKSQELTDQAEPAPEVDYRSNNIKDRITFRGYICEQLPGDFAYNICILNQDFTNRYALLFATILDNSKLRKYKTVLFFYPVSK